MNNFEAAEELRKFRLAMDKQNQRIARTLPHLRQFDSAAIRFANAFARAVKPVMDSIANFAAEFYEKSYALYLADGAPYGETHEGFMKWFEENCTEYKQQREAQDVAERRLIINQMVIGTSRFFFNGVRISFAFFVNLHRFIS